MTKPAVALVQDAPPHQRDQYDLDLEGSILAALLCDDGAGTHWRALAPMLRGEHFYADANRLVYEAIAALRGAGKPADPVSVCALMRKADKLRLVGGAVYVAETLALAQPAVAHPQVFAAEVIELWRLRQLVDCMARLTVLVRAGELSSDGVRGELRELFRGFK